MSFSLVVHDTIPLNGTRKRSALLTCPRRSDPTPIPPSLVNSPYLSSPNSVFRRKITLPRWPSQDKDEWLRDMIPIDKSPGSDDDAKSEGSNDSTPSPTSSDSSFSYSLFPPSSSLLPPSPLLQPRAVTPDIAALPANRAQCGSGFGLSPHS